MKRRGQTRSQILGCAEELMQRCGFHGFSYHHIATRLGVRNAAVHYYFPSKVDLGLALVERYRENFRFWKEQLAVRRSSPVDALERFFELEGRYRAEGKVCPLGVVGVEYPGIPEPMHEATRALLDEAVDWLASTLDAGRAGGELRFSGDPTDRALSLLAALQGGLQLARIGHSEAFERIVGELRRELGMPDVRGDGALVAAG